jgi:5,10-methylenetetrahydromethanopterin reductase
LKIHLGLGALQWHTPDKLIRMVQTAEALGYENFWYGNEKFFRDPWQGLALAAMHSKRLALGTFIQDPYTLHPALTAVAIATLDEISGGRAVLLMGSGGGGGPIPLAYDRRKPAQALREAVQVIRGMWRGERVFLDGEIIRARGARLGFPARPDIPIYIASRGNVVLQTAGEIADGVMIATYATPRGVQHALSRVERGLARSGRTRADIKLFSRIDTWIDTDRATAREALRHMIAGFLTTSYPDMGFVHANGLELSRELQSVLAKKDREYSWEHAHLVPDEVVDAFAWTGTPDDVAQQIAAVARLGISNITVLLHPPRGKDEFAAIHALAEQVKPAVEELTKNVEVA